MLKLFQREECPFSAKVRALMAKFDLSYEVVNVTRLGSQRSEVLALDGNQNAEVPVLVDGDRVIRGTDAILSHLGETYGKGGFGDPSYGLTRRLPGVSYGDAITKVTEALKTEGFGILTEIDVKATLKKKIDVDVRPYVILGACNPQLAHKAMSGEPAIGLLLPCNVVVAEDPDGTTVVSAIDPRPMFRLIGNEAVEPIANEVRQKLSRVLTAL